jgi:membrane associated rhomboid family serine protease
VFPLKDNIPTDRFPIVTVALILINTVVYFVLQKHTGGIFSGPDNVNVVKYGAIPCELTHPGQHIDETLHCTSGQGAIPNEPNAYLKVLFSMFMHGGILHLAGNMLFLWIFGNNVEDSMGRAKFVLFYLAGGVAALALQVAVGPSSGVPTVGASGAIAAVLGGYILLYPRARVLTLIFIVIFFTVIELPALLVLGLWFAEQAVFGATNLTQPTGGGGGGVAYFAHIGGFAFGLLTIRALARRVKSVPARRPVF